MQFKTMWHSKTFWFNVLTAVVFVMTYFFGFTPNEGLTETLTSIVSNPLFTATVNILLRKVTKTQIGTPQ